ncbi:MAG: hypothetical protein WDO74_27915 [Pseudomonadota bacterium]
MPSSSGQSGSAGSSAAQGGSETQDAPDGGNVRTPLTWKVLATSLDSKLNANPPSAASRGRDAGVAYVEYSDTMPPTARVVMQRFDASGEQVGSLAALGSEADRFSDVSLASDGKQYAACWTFNLEVHCSLVDEQGQVQLNAVEFDGQYPTLVASPSGWAIGYTISGAQLRLQALTPALELNGSPVDLQQSARFQGARLGPLLTPVPSGFALVGAKSADEHEGLLRLDADLQPLGDATPLGRDFWMSGQLVASDTRAAVSLSVAYGSFLLLLDAHQVTAELPVAGGGKAGMDHALVLTQGGIGAAWLDGVAEARRRFFADGHDAEIGLETHDNPSTAIGLPEEGIESYQQLLQVADRTLLVARQTRSGSLANAPIRVATLTFP